MNFRAEIISQGHEVLTGQTVDTNAAWLGERLTALGFSLTRQSTVGDDLFLMTDLFRERLPECEILICTGGLGPTSDDLTAEAVVKATNSELVFDAEAWEQIQQRFRNIGRPCPDTNIKQAWLPKGAVRLDNAQGSAPGFMVVTQKNLLFCLPGVPHEMKAMWTNHVEPILKSRFTTKPTRLVTLRTTGIGESALQELFKEITEDGFTIGYRTMNGENQIKLIFEHDISVDEVKKQALIFAQKLEKNLFSIEGIPGEPGGSLIETVAHLLSAHQATLAIAESCTGGTLSSLCTSISGSSEWFLGGITAYANTIKNSFLDVPELLIATKGAVSAEVACAMAEGARRRFGSTYALSTTGIAGHSGGGPEKPVGTVFLALATPTQTLHRCVRFPGDRNRVQLLAAHAAIDLLRRNF